MGFSDGLSRKWSYVKVRPRRAFAVLRREHKLDGRIIPWAAFEVGNKKIQTETPAEQGYAVIDKNNQIRSAGVAQ